MQKRKNAKTQTATRKMKNAKRKMKKLQKAKIICCCFNPYQAVI